MNLFKLVSFILDPKKAVDYADTHRSDQHTVGFINEFFSKYLEFGKSNREIVNLNEKIDRKIETNNKIANALIKLRKIRKEVKKTSNKDQIIKTTKNFGVSSGIARGVILNIKSTKQLIPKNCIGIFPTSGAKYDVQFLKCKGIIFLNGAITSHGSILAREFGIPAIVSPNLNIVNGKRVTLDGGTGNIKVVDTND